jgi:acyl carrier protein
MLLDDDRLMRCFELIFPVASRDEITTEELDAMPGWDSLRGVTLLAILDEEFGLQMDLQELLDLGTYGAVKDHLLQRDITP